MGGLAVGVFQHDAGLPPKQLKSRVVHRANRLQVVEGHLPQTHPLGNALRGRRFQRQRQHGNLLHDRKARLRHQPPKPGLGSQGGTHQRGAVLQIGPRCLPQAFPPEIHLVPGVDRKEMNPGDARRVGGRGQNRLHHPVLLGQEKGLLSQPVNGRPPAQMPMHIPLKVDEVGNRLPVFGQSGAHLKRDLFVEYHALKKNGG